MFKKLIALALLGLVACQGDLYTEDPNDADELGQIEQAYAASNSPTFQFGTRTGPSGLACDKTTTGQVCSIIKGATGTSAAKNVAWRFTPVHGFTAVEMITIQSAISGLDAALSKWTFSEVSGGAPAIQIGKAGVGGASTSNNIDAFRQVNWFLPVSLTEGLTGSYQAASVIISIDMADITTRGTAAGGASFVNRLLFHAAANSFEAAIGLGTRDDAISAGTYNDRTVLVLPNGAPFASSGGLCQLNSFNPSTVSVFDLVNPQCASD